MSARCLVFAVVALLAGTNVRATTDCTQPAAVCAHEVSGAFALIKAGTPATILADAKDYPGVLRAAHDLQSDMSSVAGAQAAFTTDKPAPDRSVIIVGTLGHSPRIDRIVREKHLDVSDVTGRWEAYTLQVVDHPEPGVDRALLIIGADKRGTIYGIYELSRRIGVSPWTWWADVPVPHQATLYAAPGRFVDAPVVRYRGIFINDEEPALGGLARAKFGGFNHTFYAHVFELILRLKANTLWPAMWGSAFADDDAENPALADSYGVVIGTSHHEPLMRAHAEWERYGHGPWDYAKNADALRTFWRRGIERTDHHESLVTIGMRGDGDEPMTQGTAIGLLERIVADQRKIIADVTGKPAERTPQVWALYKEVQDYFDAGMRVPDDVTLLFSDDNWGNLRRVPALGKKRSGGYGIYYHFDYVGGPRNYKWINTTQIERTWEQMRLASAYGANQLWIANVGDIKPLELPISFFLDLAWNPQAMTAQKLAAYPSTWAAEQFGAKHAAEIGDLLTRYTQYNARRKPELLSPQTYSLTNFHEAERIQADWNDLATRAKRVGAALPAAYHDAWYELVGYPILASANLNALYIAAARNRLYAAQGRAGTNEQAALTQRLFAHDAELARVYEQDIAGGKWPHMMSQTHIGYTGWQQPEHNVIPATVTIAVPEKAGMGVAVEGHIQAWPAVGCSGSQDQKRNPLPTSPCEQGEEQGRLRSLPRQQGEEQSQLHSLPRQQGEEQGALRSLPCLQGRAGEGCSVAEKTPRLPPLDLLGTTSRDIVVFDRGSKPLRYTASASPSWLRVEAAAGQIDGEQKLRVEADWAAVPAGDHVGAVTLRGSDGSVVKVAVPVSKPADADAMHGFIESDDHIAIEAANYAHAIAAPGLTWQTIPHLGRTLSGVTLLPATTAALTPGGNGTRLEYPLWLRESGDVQVRVVLSPSLDFLNRGGLRFAVSIGDEPPQVVTVKADPSPGSAGFAAWERAVSDSVYVAVSPLRIAHAGAQTLKLWPIDPGLVFQRIEVVRGTMPASYLGPPQSQHR